MSPTPVGADEASRTPLAERAPSAPMDVEELLAFLELADWYELEPEP